MTQPGIGAPDDDQAAYITAVYGYRTQAALLDLLQFSDMAARLVARGRSAYDRDETLRLAAEAITYRLGEAVARLSNEFIAGHPQVEWRKIKGMRNIVSHQYAHIDYEILWTALADRIPVTADQIRRILAQK